MWKRQWVFGLTIGTAIVGLIPPPHFGCFVSAAVSKVHPAKVVPSIIDIALVEYGVLMGSLVDASGRPLANSPIILGQAAGPLAQTASDDQGRFQFSGLRGGVYQVFGGDSTQIVRVWVQGTAPPVAKTEVALVSQGDTVRGQHLPGPLGRCWEKCKCCFTNPWVIGGIVAVAVAVPVAIHNANRDKGS